MLSFNPEIEEQFVKYFELHLIENHDSIHFSLSGIWEDLSGRCCLFIPPENIRKPKGFMTISGGTDKQHGAVMG